MSLHCICIYVCSFIDHFIATQARQWVEMWKGHLGEDATLGSIIATLDERNDSKDIVAYLKSFALSVMSEKEENKRNEKREQGNRNAMVSAL